MLPLRRQQIDAMQMFNRKRSHRAHAAIEKRAVFWLGDGVRISCSAVTVTRFKFKCKCAEGTTGRKRPQP
jgi:hypothetical protein